MIAISILTLLGASIAISNAQFSSGPGGTITCTGGGAAYCAGGSLSSSTIIRCSGTKGQPGNCNDNLEAVPPVGVKTNALCYQTSPTAGDAACSFNGIVYPDTGPPFPISNGTNSTTSSYSPTLSLSTTASIPTAPGPVIPITMTIASSGSSGSSSSGVSIPTAPGLPTGLSTVRTGGGSVPYPSSSSAGAAAPPYPIITSTKIVPAPTGTATGAGTGGADGATGSSGVSAAGGMSESTTPSTSPIGSSNSGGVVGRKSVDAAFVGGIVGLVVVGMVFV